MDNPFSIFLLVIFVFLMMRFLETSNKKQPLIKGNTIILKVNKLYGIVAVIVIVLTVILTIMDIPDITSQADVFNILGINVLVFTLSIPLLLMVKNYKVEVTEEVITHYNIFGKEKVIRWQEIKKIKYGRFSSGLFLHTDVTKMTLHVMSLTGFSSFIKILKKKLEPHVYQDVLSDLDRLV